MILADSLFCRYPGRAGDLRSIIRIPKSSIATALELPVSYCWPFPQLIDIFILPKN